MVSGPAAVKQAGETGIETRQPVTLTISPVVLRDVDRVRGVAGRSIFFELGARLLCALLERGEESTAKAISTTTGAKERMHD